MIRTILPLGAIAAVLAFASPAAAQSFWVPTAGGDWFVADNWSPSGVPNSASAWVQFGRGGTGSQTINVNGTATVGRITFKPGVNTSSYAWTLSNGAIDLNNGVSASLIERAETDADQTVNTPLTIAGNGALTVNNAGFSASGAVNGIINLASVTGTGSKVTINSGTGATGVVVIQSGTYGGAGSVTDVQKGVLRANEGTGLPNNTALKLNGGIWEVTQPTLVSRSLGTAPGNIQILGTSGFSALDAGGTLRIQLNGGTGQVQWGSSNFNPTTLGFGRGASSGNENYTFENAIDLNGTTRTIGASNKALVGFGGVISNSTGTAGLTITRFAGGSGTVVLSGTNTYTGPTTVQLASTLRARDGIGLPVASNLVLNSGTLEYLDFGAFNRAPGTGAGQIRVLGTSGFAAFGGQFSVQLGAGPVVWGSADFNPSKLQFGSPNATATVDFQTGIDLNGGARFISYWDRSPSTTDNVLLSGVISNSTGTPVLILGGNGTISLSAANTYNGETAITDTPALPNTVVKLTGTGSIANSPTVTVGVQRTLDVTGLTGGANYDSVAGRFQVASGQTLAGSGTVVGNVLVGPNAVIRGGSDPTRLNDPTGQLSVNGALRFRGGVTGLPTLAVDLNGANASGATVSRVAVTGAGNVWDIDTSSGPARLQLLSDQNLVLNQAYTYIIGSSAGGFTRNGAAVTAYTYGSDFELKSATFASFSDVTLTVDGSNNLVLTFTPVPVPEPATVLAVAAVGLAGWQMRRRV